MTRLHTLAVATSAFVALAACATAPAPMAAMAPFDTASLPAAVQVPAGHRMVLHTVGVGEITYECRAKVNMAGAFEWVFVGPMATLQSRDGKPLGRYFGPPATWAAADGSAVTGAQVAVAPASPGSIPLQLVKANPATGTPGAMTGTAYIQRVATMGGVPPSRACDAGSLSQREIVKYQADYLFWQPA